MHREKWPWDYAKEIIKLRTREQRAAALLAVPEKFQDATRKHVIDHFLRLKHRKQNGV